jgi:hypothetical protein
MKCARLFRYVTKPSQKKERKKENREKQKTRTDLPAAHVGTFS